jgi:hypothetical protein
MPTPPNQILLSVLVLSIPSRLSNCLIPTYDRLLKQIGDEVCVEVLCLVDNKSMSIWTRDNYCAMLERIRNACDIAVTKFNKEKLNGNPNVIQKVVKKRK